MKKVLHALFLVLISGQAFANVLNVPVPFGTIQTALNACLTGDTVIVQPGVYYENIFWPTTANVKLIAGGDTSNCIIDGSGIDRVISVTKNTNNLADTSTLIQGFTIRNGYLGALDNKGAGIRILGRTFTIEKCRIIQHRIHGHTTSSTGRGAGIFIDSSFVVIKNTEISDNKMDSVGGGFGGAISALHSKVIIDGLYSCCNRLLAESYAEGGSIATDYDTKVILTNSLIEKNCLTSNSWTYGGGIEVGKLTDTLIAKNLIIRKDTLYSTSWNGGGGIENEGEGLVSLENVLIAENVMYGPANWFDGSGISLSSSSTFIHVTIAFNKAINGIGNTLTSSAVYTYWNGSNIDWSNSIFWNPDCYAEIESDNPLTGIINCDIKGGYPGTNNINANPLFIGSGDYHLLCNSPCVNVIADSVAVPFDLDGILRPAMQGTNADIGCYEYNQHFSPLVINTGPFPVCYGDTAKLVTVPYNNTHYQWLLDGNSIPFANDTFLYVSLHGNYSIAQSDSSCILNSPSVYLAFPNVSAVLINGDDTVCDNHTATLFQTGSLPGTSYLWLSDSLPITGANLGYYEVAVNGNYSLIVNTYGCIDTTNTISVVFIPSPAKPVLTLLNDTFFSNALNNQWYLSGQPIAGATNNYYIPVLTGNYSVATSQDNGCESVSDPIWYSILSIVTLPEKYFSIYPNPASNKINVEIDEAIIGAQIDLYDVTGSLIQTSKLETRNSQLEISNLSSGFYIAEIKTKEASLKKRWMKM